MANGDTAGTLKAGESVTQTIYWGGWLSTVEVTENYNFSVGLIGTDNTEALDLDDWYVSMKPSSFSDSDWDRVWTRFSSLVGTTWGDYVGMLGGISSSLSAVGSDVQNADTLLSAALAWSSDSYNPFGTIASSVDNAVSGSAFSLSFGRSYKGESLSLRNYESDLGIGWDHNWNFRLAFDDEGSVSVTGAFGETRLFQPANLPNDTMAYRAVSLTDTGTLARAADRSYTLTEQNGTVYKFTADDLLASITDANGNTVTATQTSGRLTHVADSQGNWLSITYNNRGKISTVSDSNDNTSVYTYDATGQYLLSVEWSDGRRIAYSYDTAAKTMQSVTFADGTHQYFTYDSGFLQETHFDDNMGSISYVFGTTPETILSYQAYQGSELQGTVYLNEFGLIAKSVDAEGRTVLCQYDENGLLTSVSNADSTATIHYDAHGNIVVTANGNGNAVQFLYNTQNWLTQLTDANGNATSFTYDAKGNQTAEGRVDGTAARWAYNSDGTVRTFTARSGETFNYTYDTKGNVTEVAYSTETDPIRYEYDAHGNVTKITDVNGDRTLFTYDVNDQLLKVEYENGRFLEYAYDAYGRQISVQSGADYHVVYTYDSWGFLDKVLDGTNGNALLTDYDYNINGNLVKELRGNGTYTVYGYDTIGYLTEKTTYNVTATAISSFLYSYDVKGQVATMTTLDGTWTYGYDLAGQVTRAVFVAAAGSLVANQNCSYTYDAAGNRTAATINGVDYVYTFNNMNQLLSDGQYEYTYDANGNMLTKTDLVSGEIWTFVWNQDGEMISATCSTGEKFEYEYDAMGNKIAMVHTDIDGNVTQTEYLIDPTGDGDITAEYDADGNLIATYTYGLGLTNKTDASGDAAYYGFDMLGSTAVVTAEDGTVLNQYTYDAWGNSLYKNETINNLFQFVGEYGVASGQNDSLISMRARWYDPASGRFISEDPIGLNAGDTNLYRYCGNGVTVGVDPSGLYGSFYYERLFGMISFFRMGGNYNVENEEGTHEQYFGKSFNIGFGNKNGGGLFYYDTEGKTIFVGDDYFAFDNLGYSSESSDNLSYLVNSIVYNDFIIRLATQMIYSNNDWSNINATFDMSYATKIHNCQDFSDSLRNVYHSIMGDKTLDSTVALTLSTDTSGSMSDDIDNVRANARAIVNSLQNSGKYNATIMRFCDTYETMVSKSTNTSSIISAINVCDTNYGNGYTENTFSMLLGAINQQSQDNVNVIIFMTDEQGDDRSLYSSVLSAAQRTNTTLYCIYSGSGSFAAALPMAASSGEYPIMPAAAAGSLESLCQETGGQFIYSYSADNTTEKIIEAIYSAANVGTGVYRARSVYYGTANENISLTATLFDSSEVKQYRWDFDDDGIYDATTDTATIEQSWASAGSYRVRVQAVDKNGAESNDTLYVDVRDRFGEAFLTDSGDLIVCGWSGNDTISVKAGTTEGSVAVCLDPVTGETVEYAVTGKIIVNAYDGENQITIENGLADRVFVYGGAGTDTLIYDASKNAESENFCLADGMIVTSATNLVFDQIENIQVSGGSAADVFEVQASQTIRYTMNGNRPTSGAAAKDKLQISVNSTENGAFAFDDTDKTNGTWNPAAGETFQSIAWTGIEETAQILAQSLATPSLEAVYGGSKINVSWNSVENASGYLVEISTSTDFNEGLAEFFTAETHFAFEELDRFSLYYFRVKALGHDEFVNSGWSSTVQTEIPEILNVPEWNLADYNYTSFKLDANTDANYTASLYGQERNGSWTLLKAWDFIGAGATATITGQTKAAENLFITGSAMELLGEILFNGGDGCAKDTVTIEGTADDDLFEINTETAVTTTPIVTENPYTGLIEHYKSFYGEKSKIYQKLKVIYDNAYQILCKHVRTTKSSYSLVSLADGASVKLTGVKDVALNALEGDDSFAISDVSANYTLAGNGGNDTLDFSETDAAVHIDLGSRSKQYALIGKSSTLRLNDTFEIILGSDRSDRITADVSGAIVVGNGGRDAVVLTGGENWVDLFGNGQSVTVRGTGLFNIDIEDGDYSVINATLTGITSELNIDASGRNIAVYNGRGTLNAEIVGDYAVVSAALAEQVTLNVFGNYGTVLTGNGADQILYSGNGGIVRTGAEDDLIYYFGSLGSLHGGDGNDIILLYDNEDDIAKNNNLFGENGNDVLYAVGASGSNRFYAGAGNDIVVGGYGDDFLFGTSGNNILIALDGKDQIFGGAGRDILMASRSSELANLEDMSDEEIGLFFSALVNAWMIDDDLEETLDILGTESLADGAKDLLYRGGGSRNLFFTNSLLDGDIDNALENRPFFDTLIDD